MIIIFAGPPGSGKGTQAQILAKKYNFSHVSTGELLRKQNGSGNALKHSLQNGELVSDNVIMKIIIDLMEQENEKTIIFDGFPRTLNQAIEFDLALDVKNLKADIFFHFDIDREILNRRIMGRFSCINCGAVYHSESKLPQIKDVCDYCGHSQFTKREDDKTSLLQKRINIYDNEIQLIEKYYQDKGIKVSIDASVSPTDVTNIIEVSLRKVGLIIKGD